jgi:Na+/proline symporter
MSGEGLNTRDMAAKLSWSFPLFLLLMALPIFPIMWASMATGVTLPAQYFTLGLPMALESPTLTIIAFVGGLSAATGATIVIIISLATMILNHWVLPLIQIRQDNLYQQISRLRRALIFVLFLAGFGFYRLLNNNFSLTELALIYFIGSLQFLPATISITFWPNINRKGFISGLILGTTIWFLGLLLPSISSIYKIVIPFADTEIPLGVEHWQYITPLSLVLNFLAMHVVSAATRPSKE